MAERSDCQASYDTVANEYVRRISDELQHKPLDRALLASFTFRPWRSRILSANLDGFFGRMAYCFLPSISVTKRCTSTIGGSTK